jgi:Helicase conserved C-terminal domain
VSQGSSLVRWLATLDADRLGDVLVRRPDTLTPPPRNVPELAARLQARDSVALALQGLPLPAVQVVEVMQSIGGGHVTLDRLAAAFGLGADDPGVQATLNILAQRALVWPDPVGGALCMAGPLWSAFPYPLRLGAPAERLLHPLPAAKLAEIAAALSLPAGRTKKDTLRAICQRLADADAVRTLVEGGPKPARQVLVNTAWNGPLVAVPPSDGYARRPTPALDWALDRALLVPDGWQHAQMPSEVAHALRGPQWRPRFDPHPPQPALAAPEPAAVSREAAAAASAAVEQVAALLDACAGTPVAIRKSGGVGVRELRRLGKATGCGETAVRLWLELAYAAALITPMRDQVVPTEAYDQWCAEEPAGRLVPLLRAWLRLPAAPLAARSPEDGPPAALVRNEAGIFAYELRPQLLQAAADLPEGQGVKGAESIEAALRWRAPMTVGLVPDAGELVGAVWQEACLLGVVAHGALTPLGRALLSTGEGADELDQVAARLLPAAVRTAMFQADLTAVVPGVPAADLAGLLDMAADRESRGGAATWRFSPASVRRALDAGRDSDLLLAQLRGFAVGGALPQPLEYLVADVARRHGAIRVRPAGCVLYADNPALVAEVASARSLAALGLTVLAPTVLLSGQPPAETLAALRSAGYAPLGEAADGSVQIEQVPRHRAPAPKRRPPADPSRLRRPPADPRALAKALLAGHRAPNDPAQHELALDPPYEDDPLPDVDDADGAIVRHAGHLSESEQALLLAAVEDGTPIEIGYTNAQGTSSVRVVEPIDLDDHLLVAWCRLRDDERAFVLDRIQWVEPAA